jgi:hypothetical protein
MINYNKVNWSSAELKDFSKVDMTDKNSSSDKFNGNWILRKRFIIDKLHEKRGVKLVDSLIKWINPNYNLNLLYDFDRAVTYFEQNSAELFNASKSGLFPITAVYYFGQKCVKMTKTKGKKSYTLKITNAQFSQIVKYLKTGSKTVVKIPADSVKSTIDSFTKKRGASKSLTEFQKTKKELQSAKNRIAKNGFSQTEKLELQSIALLINSALLSAEKPASKKPASKNVKKPASKNVKKAVKK